MGFVLEETNRNYIAHDPNNVSQTYFHFSSFKQDSWLNGFYEHKNFRDVRKFKLQNMNWLRFSLEDEY